MSPEIRPGICVLLTVLLHLAPLHAGQRPASRGIDRTPPEVELELFGAAEALFGLVHAEDESGIARVSVALDGSVVSDRIEGPFDFTILIFPAAPPPEVVCVVAEDSWGNSARDCVDLGGPFPALDCMEHSDCPPVVSEDSRLSGRELVYCRTVPGNCDGIGACEAVPLQGGSCGGDSAEVVCGCDGNSYCSEFVAALQGVSVDHPGFCGGTSVVGSVELQAASPTVGFAPFAVSFVAVVLDALGNPIGAGVLVEVLVVGDGVISGGQLPIMTDPQGRAVFDLLGITIDGTAVIAVAGGVSSNPVIVSIEPQ